jgi:hypothetical protein
MAYYYATISTDPDGSKQPEGLIPPSIECLHYDDGMNRVVIRTQPTSLPIPVEWSEVDEGLIETDYPGLLGGA